MNTYQVKSMWLFDGGELVLILIVYVNKLNKRSLTCFMSRPDALCFIKAFMLICTSCLCSIMVLLASRKCAISRKMNSFMRSQISSGTNQSDHLTSISSR